MIQPAATPEAKRATASGRERLHRAAQGHEDRGQRAHRRDGAVFAEAIAERTDDELDRALADRIGRDHDGGFAHGDAEIDGDLRQQRVGHAHHCLARKARDRQQHDGARGNFLWR